MQEPSNAKPLLISFGDGKADLTILPAVVGPRPKFVAMGVVASVDTIAPAADADAVVLEFTASAGSQALPELARRLSAIADEMARAGAAGAGSADAEPLRFRLALGDLSPPEAPPTAG